MPKYGRRFIVGKQPPLHFGQDRAAHTATAGRQEINRQQSAHPSLQQPRRDSSSMAARAHSSYTAGKYEEALSHLSQLTLASSASAVSGEPSTGGLDFRTLHNRALCEHGIRGFSDPGKLEATLRSLQVQLRGKARGSGLDGEEEEDEEQEEQADSKAAGAMIGSSLGAGPSSATALGLADLDADASVLLYNLSALHFQQKQYGAAQAVLEHLFLHIEPLDESLAIHICLLLLDVLCHSARGNLHSEENRRRFAAQSAAVLGCLERPHVLNSSSSSGGGDR